MSMALAEAVLSRAYPGHGQGALIIEGLAEPIHFPACITGPRPVVHDPVEYSAWVLAMACFQMGWTVLVLSGRHWMSMLMLRARLRVSRALHSLTFAWAVAGISFGLCLTSIATTAAIFIWR